MGLKYFYFLMLILLVGVAYASNKLGDDVWEIKQTDNEINLQVSYKLISDRMTEFCIDYKDKSAYTSALSKEGLDIKKVPISIISQNKKDIKIIDEKNTLDLTQDWFKLKFSDKDCFKVEYSNISEVELKIGWHSISIVSTTTYDSVYNTYGKAIVRDSFGVLHMIYVDGGVDLNYRNSTNNGTTWSTAKEILTGTVQDAQLLINQTNGLYAVYYNGGDVDVQQSRDRGGTWAARANLYDSGFSVSDHSCAVNRNGVLSCCVTHAGGIGIVNISTGFNNPFSLNSSTQCDIEFDNNNDLWVVDNKDNDVYAHKRSAAGTINALVYNGAEAPFISFAIANNSNKMYVAFCESGDLNVANSTDGITWSNVEVDSNRCYRPIISLNQDGNVFIFYGNGTGTNAAAENIWRANRTNSSNTWAINKVSSSGVEHSARSINQHYPKFNTITNEIYWAYQNSSSIYFNKSSISWSKNFPVGIDTTAPAWGTLPNAKTITYRQGFVNPDFNATDAVGVYGYYLHNQSVYWQINQASGVLSNKSIMPVGVYKYNISVNDTSNNKNYTSYTFTVNKATPVLSVSYTNVTYPTSISFTASETNQGDADVTYKLHRNGTVLAGLTDTGVKSAGSYNYSFNASGGMNWTASKRDSKLIISKGTPSMSISATDKTYFQNLTATGSDTNTGDADLSYKLYINGTEVTNPYNQRRSAGRYYLIYNTTGGLNWTQGSVAVGIMITISKNSTACDILFNASDPIAMPAKFKVYTNCRSNYTLWNGGTLISNGTVVSGAGTYIFKLNRTDSQNYTYFYDTEDFTITKTVPVMTLTALDKTYFQNVTATTSESNNNDADMTYNLYLNGTLIPSGQYNSRRSAGRYYFVYNTSGGANYSARSLSTTVTVSKNSTACSLSFNTSNHQTYPSGFKVIADCKGGYTLWNSSYSTNNGTPFNTPRTYTFKLNRTDTQNYSNIYATNTFTINKATPSLVLTILPSTSETYPTETTATGTGCPAGLSCSLTRAGFPVSNPDIQTLGAGDYYYSYSTTGNQFYNADSDSDTLHIDSGLIIDPNATSNLTKRFNWNWNLSGEYGLYDIREATCASGKSLCDVIVGASIDHNSLLGLQGGDSDERYHLNTSQVTKLNNLPETCSSGDSFWYYDDGWLRVNETDITYVSIPTLFSTSAEIDNLTVNNNQFIFGNLYVTGTSEFSENITAPNICYSNGTNCAAQPVTLNDTLQSVTNRGNITSNPIKAKYYSFYDNNGVGMYYNSTSDMIVIGNLSGITW